MPKKWLSISVLTGIVIVMVLICNLFSLYDDRIELEKKSKWQFYAINPETILDSLAQGNKDVFTALEATPEALSSSTAPTIQWNQEDFFRIAQAISEQSWGESLGEKYLFSMSFEMNCSDVGDGTFNEASFDFYKVIKSEEEDTRIEYWITIIPAINLVYTVEVVFQPNVNNKKPLDIARYQITVDEGLQIAESNGGYDARIEVDNDCEISAFSPTTDGESWEINYVNYPEKFVHTLFRIAINPKTGQYNILYPNPK